MSLEISFPDTSPEAKLIQDMIASGRFEDEQAVMKQALSELKEREAQRLWLRTEIQKGLDSGVAEHRTVEQRLSDNRARLKARQARG